MKRGRLLAGFILLIAFFSIFSLNSVIAPDPRGPDIYSTGTTPAVVTAGTDIVDSVAKVINPYIKYVVGETPDGQLMLIKFLFLIMLLAVIYYAVEQVPAFSDNPFVAWTISIVTALIAIRYLSTQAIVNFIWLPTGVLGVALAALLPFVLYFFFIEAMDSSIVRKVGWTIFIVIFAGLALYRWSDLKITEGAAKGQWWGNLAWIYIIIIIISLIMVIFDRQIKARTVMWAIAKKGKELNDLKIADLKVEMDHLKEVIKSSATTPADRTAAQKRIIEIRKSIEAILRSA